jgi:3-methyladenine DNA glycosylase/8-oxoguanine DNA glycosylase
MFGQILGAIAAHHGEAADPILLAWIKEVLDSLLGLGPWTVVVFLGLLMAGMPLVLATSHWLRNAHSNPRG